MIYPTSMQNRNAKLFLLYTIEMTKSEFFYVPPNTQIHTYVIFMYLQIHILKLMGCTVCGIHNWLHPIFL
jgi:hypothetical protein